jgi:PHP family Zn ribbon phosphoesterase
MTSGIIACNKCKMWWVVSDIENAHKCPKDGRHNIKKSMLNEEMIKDLNINV